MQAAAALAAFDPMSLGLTFACSRYDEVGAGAAPAAEIPGAMAAVTSADQIRSVLETLQRVVPAELLTHEMTHLYQITATTSGLREFAAMHRYVRGCCAVIAACAEHSGGAVPIGFLTRPGTPAAEIRRLVDELAANRTALLHQKGGVLLPLEVLAPYRVRRSAGTIFEVKGIFGGDEPTWCADLTDLGGPRGTAVTLGTVHLVEGQALMTEFLRGLTGTGDHRLAALNSAPPHPYQLVRSIFLSFCRNRPVDTVSAEVELLYVIDAALMAEADAFGHFLAMCQVLVSHPDRHLTGTAPEQVEAFQDMLLGAKGTPVAGVAALTAALSERVPAVLAEIRQSSPLFRSMSAPWSYAFATMLTQRARADWGGGTALALARMPHESLAMFAVDLVTTTFFQPVSLTDDPAVGPEVLSIASIPRVKPVLEEILYGGAPCEVRARCGLPERPACAGLPALDAVRPAGQRCMREHALVTVAEQLGVTRLTHLADCR